MSGNARFHDKLHRSNHHTLSTAGLLDSAYDPIASPSHPFQGDFILNGNLSASGNLSADELFFSFPNVAGISPNTTDISYLYSTTTTNSSKWQSTFNSLCSMSANYDNSFTWVKNNSSNMHVDRLGIDTDINTYPSNIKLAVQGDTVIYGNLSSLGSTTLVNLTSNSTDALSVISPGFNSALYIDQQGGTLPAINLKNSGSGPMMALIGNGNVGIGEISPPEKLTVAGAISARGIIYAWQGNSEQWNQSNTTIQAYSGKWQSNYNTVSSLSSGWSSSYTTLINNSSKWSNAYNTLTSNSATWNITFSNLNANSANWDSVYNTVGITSANWAYDGSDIKALSSNWENTYSTVSTNSAIWSSGITLEDVQDSINGMLSAGAGIAIRYDDPSNKLEIKSTNAANLSTSTGLVAGAYALAYDTRRIETGSLKQSGNQIFIQNGVFYTTGSDSTIYTTGAGSHIYTNSGNISSTTGNLYLSTGNVSAKNAFFKTISAADSLFVNGKNIGVIDLSFLGGLSSNWQNTYSTVNTNSANWNYQGSDLKALSSNWQNSYTTVNTNSAKWQNTYSTVNTNSANWNYQGSDLKALSSNWQNSYTTVNTNSATWSSYTNYINLKSYSETSTAPTINSNIVTLNLALGTIFNITLASNINSFNFLNIPTGVNSLMLILKQDSTGGKTVSWVLGGGKTLRWSGGAPTITSTANATDIYSFMSLDGNIWYGSVAGKNFV